jgi:hypothetical protein
VLLALLILGLGRRRGRRTRAIRVIAGKNIVTDARTEVLLIGWAVTGLRDGHQRPTTHAVVALGPCCRRTRNRDKTTRQMAIRTIIRLPRRANPVRSWSTVCRARWGMVWYEARWLCGLLLFGVVIRDCRAG